LEVLLRERLDGVFTRKALTRVLLAGGLVRDFMARRAYLRLHVTYQNFALPATDFKTSMFSS